MGRAVHFFLIGILFLFLNTHVASAQSLKQQTILILGDSLSAAYGLHPKEGWVTLWEKQLNQNTRLFRVVNSSRSGETTQGARQRIVDLLRRHQPDWILIELGANDGLRGFPPSVIEKNLASLIDTAKRFHCRVILMQIQLPESYGQEYVRAFEAIFPKLAESKHVMLVPFLMTPLANKPELFQSDRIHPNRAAQPLIAAFMAKKLSLFFQAEQQHGKK